MNKLLYKLALGICTATMFVACSDDVDDEITDVQYDRLFSPTSVEAKVQSQVNVRLSWTSKVNATGYNIEVFADDSLTFVGTPTLTFESVTENPYTITNLEGETVYSVRIQAVGNDITESKWTGVAFKTGSEQILSTVATEDLEAKAVTLYWTAGATATNIILTPTKGGDKVTYAVTAADITNGSARIEGLTPETEYTAVLKNGEKTRGTRTFTTAIDLGGVIVLYPEMDSTTIAGIIETAKADTTLLFFPSESSNAFDVGNILVTKSLTFKAMDAYPVVVNTKFILDGACSNVTFDNIDFVSTGGALITPLNIPSGANLTISNCFISGYKNLLIETDNSTSVQAGALNMSNLKMTGFSGGRAIDFQKKKINFATVSFTNSTVYEACSGSDLFRFDYVADRAGAVYTVSNCTFYNVNATSKGLFYIRSNASSPVDFTASVSKCLFAYSALADQASVDANTFFSEDAKSNGFTFSKNYYFNATSLLEPVAGGGKLFDATGSNLIVNPFTAAQDADFTITEETLIDNEIGDARWRTIE